MASQQANNTEILKLILAQLHRIETRVNDISVRISTLELSIASEKTCDDPAAARSLNSSPSEHCSCAIPPLLSPRFHAESREQHASASAYLASVDQLRRRFEFDDKSDMAPEDAAATEPNLTAGGEMDPGVDNYSVSVYPSRPLSRYHLSRGNIMPRVEVPEIPSVRYEDISTGAGMSPGSSGSGRSSSCCGDVSPMASFSDGQASPSTARTSFSSWSRRSPAAETLKRLRSPLERAASMRRSKRKTASAAAAGQAREDLSVETTTLAAETCPQDQAVKERDLIIRYIQQTRKVIMVCVGFGPRLVNGIGRGMVNQQLKMLGPHA